MNLWHVFLMGVIYAITSALVKVFLKRMLAESPDGTLAADIRNNV